MEIYERIFSRNFVAKGFGYSHNDHYSLFHFEKMSPKIALACESLSQNEKNIYQRELFEVLLN